MKSRLFFFIALFSLQLAAHAQSKGIEPMQQFMQANADSTLILEFTNDWLHFPEYYLLSKKGDTISCYTYKTNEKYSFYGPTPAKISQAMYKLHMKIFSEPADINPYFRSYTEKIGERRAFWNQVAALQPWQLKDDAVEGNGCPAAPHASADRISPVVYDGGGIKLYLLTNSAVKILFFDAPKFYEENCPGRRSRAAINNIGALFTRHFIPEKTKR